MSAMFSMMVLRMKACPQHSTGKEGVTISLNILQRWVKTLCLNIYVKRWLTVLRVVPRGIAIVLLRLQA
ncbi:hypothetical protein FMJ23_31475 [Klebsiella michiganensis]|nr:hypothetical protein [Klebsiella michiganensis]MBZ7423177.1 hypothetical protein [Klebsiella michiganensis]